MVVRTERFDEMRKIFGKQLLSLSFKKKIFLRVEFIAEGEWKT